MIVCVGGRRSTPIRDYLQLGDENVNKGRCSYMFLDFVHPKSFLRYFGVSYPLPLFYYDTPFSIYYMEIIVFFGVPGKSKET